MASIQSPFLPSTQPPSTMAIAAFHTTTPPHPPRVMDQRHSHLESLGIFHRLFNFISKTLDILALKLMMLCRPLSHGLAICHRLFNFTMQTLATQAVKPVILGQPGDRRWLDQVPVSDASAPTATIISPRKGYKELPIGPDTASETQEKGLKKSVSMNERVEEIPNTGTSKKKKTGPGPGPEKMASLECDKGKEPKPLKPILKVGSNLTTKKSVSFTIPVNNG